MKLVKAVRWKIGTGVSDIRRFQQREKRYITQAVTRRR